MLFCLNVSFTLKYIIFVMSRQRAVSELPSWAVELEDSFNGAECATLSSNGTAFRFMSTPVVCLNQLAFKNLPQDVIAAGEEIDSIVNELWRSAIGSGTDISKSNHHGSESRSQYCHNGILLSVLKGTPCENSVIEVGPSNVERESFMPSFSTSEGFARLRKEIPPESISNKFKCDKCERCYTWLSDLAKHQKTHSGKLYSCFHCQKNFSLKSDLSKHVRVHNSMNVTFCKDCGKSFFSMGDFHKHVRTHTGEKPYHCNVCSKSFSASDNYQKHVRIHSGEKPLCCVECGQRFLKKSNLLQHRRIHLGEKPFQCDLCGLSFTQKTHMKNHISTHTGLKPFSCLKCGQHFTRNSDLNRHHKRAHADMIGNRGL